ncbi:integrase [Tamlana nanhaiensis]|uniref:Integrase n=1 Tax=Neotamlana nanhaiensis TaxID=1382798 RepID=A0A0D7W4G2_9FLAO|nr:site-specific integrase [Tamlana nanhaiensis]KJD33991.1 integrase [Tamlana nanhaiensis]
MASINILLRKKANARGEYPIVMRIVKERKSKTITLGISCYEKDWDFNNKRFKKSHPNWNQRNRILLKLEQRALKIVDDFLAQKLDFTLAQFEEKFRGTKLTKTSNVLEFFDMIIKEMVDADRISNANAYKSTKDSLLKFKGNHIPFQSVTPEFLEKYEAFLRINGNQNGGIAFKMRELRSIINKAITRKLIPQEIYPFRDYKISKLKSKPTKRALTIDEFRSIRDIDLSEHPHLIETHNYFMFSIYTRGMNFQDMMLLKWSNIQNGRIHYTRSKTKGKFNLEVIDKAQEILDYYKTQNRFTQYVFPILLKEDLTAQQIHYRKCKVLSMYNKRLKELGRLANIEKPLTSYVARHSFATILKMSGTPIEKISEMMGHADVNITMSYLKEFDNETLDKENRKLMDL